MKRTQWLSPSDLYQNIVNIPEGKRGAFEVKHTHKPAGWQVNTGNLRMAMFGQPIETLTFEEPTVWHNLLEDDGVWMTDLPCEVYQMRRELEYAEGDVLIGGLGLGVAVSLLALEHEDINSIHVVELKQEVVDLVAPYVSYPGVSFEVMDIHDYMANEPTYDFAMFDTWASDSEYTFFNEVLPLLQRSKNIGTVTCWNENIMRGQLANALMTRAVFYWDQHRDALLEGTGGPEYEQGWSAPFFRWYVAQGEPPFEDIQALANLYAATYGTEVCVIDNDVWTGGWDHE